jgi:hypothetical protein
MELFLNLCWLTLLLPAALLWRRRAASGGHATGFQHLCVLGCALVLLFPVISISDDLHAMHPEMEESKRSFHHAGHCACGLHSQTHSWQPALPGSAPRTVTFEPVGMCFLSLPALIETSSASIPVGRAPPFASAASL